jgi:hypothetical protein
LKDRVEKWIFTLETRKTEDLAEEAREGVPTEEKHPRKGPHSP